MRRLLVLAAEEISLQAAASVALRTKPTGPVGLVVLPQHEVAPAAAELDSGSQIGGVARLPLPTPGAVRVASQLRRAGHPATARWRLVICSPLDPGKVDDSLAIIEAACGSVTALHAGGYGHPREVALIGCDLAVGVVAVDAPDELVAEADAALLQLGKSSAVVRLSPPGLGAALPLAGVCPPPQWVPALDDVNVVLAGGDEE